MEINRRILAISKTVHRLFGMILFKPKGGLSGKCETERKAIDGLYGVLWMIRKITYNAAV
ncbi:hypothetical protein [Holospora curviuscula]|uniref:Uncharacterized protein n=1 Tax=Holospora curviuscula TaxID=1082868 RepID=A0A2S5R7R9_9PROT|nr:hypothetical protein [Holospora curviuscula]PPE03368.1 hypothetical protein HCUR_01201 [Holospora curviuscula]